MNRILKKKIQNTKMQFIQKTISSEYIYFLIQYQTIQEKEISSSTLSDLIQQILDYMYGNLIMMEPVEVIALYPSKYQAILKVHKKHAVEVRAAFTFLHKEIQQKTKLIAIYILAAEPFLHCLSSSNPQVFFQQYLVQE